MQHTKVLLSLFALGAALTLTSCANAQTNIALNKKITTNIPSNYALTKDKNPAQLVDGKYAGSEHDAANNTSSLWVQKGAITWSGNKLVTFTIDLGEQMPISGICYSTAAGSAAVQFPSFAGIAVSDDAKSWFYQGDLISLSSKNGTPELGKYTKYRFATHDLKTKGRYVALAVKQTPYLVTDEIEVYSGDSAWLALPVTGKAVSSPEAMQGFAATAAEETFIKRRVSDDIKTIRQKITYSALPAARKSTFMAQLDDAAAENDAFTLTDDYVSTRLPINATHQKAMSVYGDFLSAEKVAPIAIWKEHRYAWTPFIAAPPTQQKPALDIAMLGNQFRSDALLVTNASAAPKTVQVSVQNPPKNAQEGWLQISQAAWTDTYQGFPVTDALLPVENGEVTIPAGFTQKLWLTVDSSKVPAGDYKSTFVVDGKAVPFRINVSQIAMQRPRLSLTVWDYTDPKSLRSGGSRGITPQSVVGARNLMQSHFVDSPWATRGILPFPKATDFDAQNTLKTSLDLADFDKWLSEWPDARNYFVFISAGKNEGFGGAKPDTPEFQQRLGSWAKVLSAHMRSKNLDPGKLALLLVDEPHIAWQDDVTANWAKAINATAPELTLISDPVWKDPQAASHQPALSQMDILMPNVQNYYARDKAVHEYFQNQRKDGKSLWFYQCISPSRLFNPQQYHRGQAWRVFSIGGDGMGFWSFGDLGGVKTSWNDYRIPQSFTPAFIDKDTAHNSVHWEAVREGVQDFEELAMLRDAIAKTTNIAQKASAQKVLDTAVSAVTSTRTNDNWYSEKTSDYTDAQLQNVRRELEKLMR